MVKIFTNIDHVPFCHSLNVSAEGVFFDFSKVMERDDVKKVLTKGFFFGVVSALTNIRMEHMSSDLKQLWPALENFKPTLLLSGLLSRTKSFVYCIQKTIPLASVDLQAILPCGDKAPGGLPTLPFEMNKFWFKLIFAAEAKLMTETKKIIKDTLDLDMNGKYELPIVDSLMNDIPSFPGPFIYGFSTLVIPRNKDWPNENFYPVGFFTLIYKKKHEQLIKNEEKITQDKSLEYFGGAGDSNRKLVEFLSKSETPPIYIGWGSMACKDPEWMTTLAVEALKLSSQRGIILSGWAGLTEEHVPQHLREYTEKNVLFLKTAPHEWLFPKCGAIVHHGGSGTTAASIRSGKPTIITPVMGDQFDFSDGVRQNGCGVGFQKQLRTLTPQMLSDSIQKCLNDEAILESAKEIGNKLIEEDGCGNFCQVLDDWLRDVYATGKWLEKHEALLCRCEEAWKKSQESSTCVIS